MVHNVTSKFSVLKIEQFIFGVLGIDIATPSGLSVVKHPLRFYSLMSATLFWVVPTICYTVYNFTDILGTALQLTLIVEIAIILLKVLFFLGKGTRIVQLISKLDTLGEEVSGSCSERSIWANSNRQSRIIVLIYSVACSMNGAVLLILPQLISIWTRGKLTLKLPNDGLFPYDLLNPTYFALTYMGWTLGTFTIASATSAIDGTFCSIIYLIRAHFDVLSGRLKHLANNIERMTHEQFREEIAEFVAYHRSAMSVALEFDEVFCLIIFINVTLHCLQICCTVYVWSNKSVDLFSRLFMLLMFVTVLFQTSIYCFGGEEIKKKSELISQEIYLHIPWDRVTVETKRILLFSLMRAQRPSTITGYFYVVDRQQLVWILKTAFSMTAVIRAIED